MNKLTIKRTCALSLIRIASMRTSLLTIAALTKRHPKRKVLKAQSFKMQMQDLMRTLKVRSTLVSPVSQVFFRTLLLIIVVEEPIQMQTFLPALRKS